MTAVDDLARARLLRRGFLLEYVTLGWNAAGIALLTAAAVTARSVARAGFGLDTRRAHPATHVRLRRLPTPGLRVKRGNSQFSGGDLPALRPLPVAFGR